MTFYNIVLCSENGSEDGTWDLIKYRKPQTAINAATKVLSSVIKGKNSYIEKMANKQGLKATEFYFYVELCETEEGSRDDWYVLSTTNRVRIENGKVIVE